MQTMRTGSPGGGYAPVPQDVVVTNRSGGTLAVGDVVQFDLNTGASDQAETTTTLPFAAEGTSAFNNVVAPNAVGLAGGAPIGVVLESITDNSTGKVRIQGAVQAYVIASTGSPTPGAKLTITTAKNFDFVIVAGEAYWARCLEDVATPTTRTLAWVLLDGTALPSIFVTET